MDELDAGTELRLGMAKAFGPLADLMAEGIEGCTYDGGRCAHCGALVPTAGHADDCWATKAKAWVDDIKRLGTL